MENELVECKVAEIGSEAGVVRSRRHQHVWISQKSRNTFSQKPLFLFLAFALPLGVSICIS